MVDDTGTGDLLGNAFIVFWRRETNEFMVKAIPLECYQAADFICSRCEQCRRNAPRFGTGICKIDAWLME